MTITIDFGHPYTLYGVNTLQYINPHVMSKEFVLSESYGGAGFSANFLTVGFPNGISCSYGCTLTMAPMPWLSWAGFSRSWDLHQRKVPPLPWTPLVEEFEANGRQVTVALRFYTV